VNKQRLGLGATEEKLQIKGSANEKVFEPTISTEDAVLQGKYRTPVP
jgi:hypothetical protein